jgi:uncharacterized protein (TIGR00251 family)
LIEHSIRDGQLIFKVQVVPRSSRSEVVGEHNGSLRVRVAAPPVEGAANKELTQVLAKAFKVSRGAVSILSGESSRLKQVGIEGVGSSELSELLRATNLS